MLSKKRVQETLRQWEKEKGAVISFSNMGLEKLSEQIIKHKACYGIVTELDLSSNRLSVIPEKIVRFTALKSINLSRNKFMVFPEVLCTMTTLRTIKIDHNFLNYIPSSIGSLKHLSRFNFSHNNISSLPEELGRLQFLDHLESTNNPLPSYFLKIIIARLKNHPELDLTNQELTALPGGILRLQEHLTKLTLTANRLSEFHSDFLELKQLKVLELRNNQICAIPASVSLLSNLEILGLSDNLITHLPDQLSELKKLSLLNISGNHISAFPIPVTNIPNLEELFINKNFPGIDIIPAELEKLKNLTTLHVRGNRIKTINVKFSSFPKLKALFLSGNPLCQLDVMDIGICSQLQDIDLSDTKLSIEIQRISSSIARKTDELNLANLSLKSPPLELIYLNQLIVLYLHKNELKEFPSSIIKMENLKILNLSNNQISNIPNSICKLNHLESLDISNNLINEFPIEIISCISLKILNCASNTISDIPNNINELINIEELYLSNNKISSLEFVLLLNNLRILHINQNNISEIPNSIGNLKNLKEIYIGDNEICELPISLANCPLECIQANNNCISEIPDSLFFIPSLRLSGNYLSQSLTTILDVKATKNKTIDLSEMSLKIIPSGLLQLTFITNLNLSGNLFEDLNIEFSCLSLLNSLNLSHNQLKNLPDWISKLSIEYLWLDSNPFDELPNIILKLDKLKLLSIRNCTIKKLPNDIISNLNEIEIFDCTGNQISEFKEKFFISMEKLKHLKCGNNLLRELPHIIFVRESLEVLEIQRNQLERLSAEPFNTIVGCKKLRDVNVSFNSLVELPVWLFNDCSLESLEWDGNCNLPHYYTELCLQILDKTQINLNIDLSFSNLNIVPSIIELQGSRISKLDLCGNVLTEIPEILTKSLTCLHILNVSRNKLKDISICSNITSLRELIAMQNEIEIFPNGLESLKQLKRIFLSFNQISEIPNNIGSFHSLKELHIANNRLEVIPNISNPNLRINFRNNPLKYDPLSVFDDLDGILESDSIDSNINIQDNEDDGLSLNIPNIQETIPKRKHAKSGHRLSSFLLSKVPKKPKGFNPPISPRNKSKQKTKATDDANTRYSIAGLPPVSPPRPEAKRTPPRSLSRSQTSPNNALIAPPSPERERVARVTTNEWSSSPPRKSSNRVGLLGSRTGIDTGNLTPPENISPQTTPPHIEEESKLI